MKHFATLFSLLMVLNCSFSYSAELPVKGLCIAAPSVKELDRFVKFIDEELSTKGVNTLILRVDFNFQYKSHPELANKDGLTSKDVQKLVEICKKHDIDLIPQINLLGHQSWASKTTNLLRVYPQFDETPHVTMPENYEWPNEDGLYCKSYCPLHPEVHAIVFDLVDEIMDEFQATSFHAGMDEVFYIGDDNCPRCSGMDKAELFANEVNKIRNHLQQKGQKLWIWGDRLIDGKTTGMGMWEASMNNTYRAIDLISKDVVICDWHYERADQTASYFAIKGFDVVTCPWRKKRVAIEQLNMLVNNRKNSTPEISERYLGMLQTVWSGASDFMDQYYGIKENSDKNGNQVECFNELFKQISSLDEN